MRSDKWKIVYYTEESREYTENHGEKKLKTLCNSVTSPF